MIILGIVVIAFDIFVYKYEKKKKQDEEIKKFFDKIGRL